MEYPSAGTAFDNCGPLFYTKNGYEKGGKIMVNPEKTRLDCSAVGTRSGLIVQENGFWLYSGYEEKHGICLLKPVIYYFIPARSRCALR